MAEYIIKSRAVFDGRADSCKPLAVWIKDDRIKKLLPYDETNAVPADVPIYDMGHAILYRCTYPYIYRSGSRK